MKVIIFGASGMVGQGVLRECLLAPAIESVLVVNRSPLGQSHPKIREIIHKNFTDFSAIEPQLSGLDACFFPLGISVLGKTEAEYSAVIYDVTMAAARVLAKFNPELTFVYVSGTATDSSEKGPVMWARVKGKTENALLRLPIKAAYMFRAGMIRPLHGIKSKTWAYRLPYIVLAPVMPLLVKFLPKYVTTTERVGRAMINAVRFGYPKKILENEDINTLAAKN